MSETPRPSSPKEILWLLAILVAAVLVFVLVGGDVWRQWFPSR